MDGVHEAKYSPFGNLGKAARKTLEEGLTAMTYRRESRGNSFKASYGEG